MKRFWLFTICLALLLQAFTPSLAEEAATEEVEIDVTESEPMPEEVGEAELSEPEALVEAAIPVETGAGALESDAAEANTPEDEPAAVMPQSIALGIKEKYAFTVSGASFRTSKKSVATVSTDGVVVGKKKGSAEIVALVDGREVGRCKVKVMAAPKKVTLSASKLTLTEGGAKQLRAKLPKNTASRIAWSSSRPTVATVDADGVVTAVREGSARITARTFNGRKATCTVAVFSPYVPTSLSLGLKTLSVGVKESVMLVPMVNEGAIPVFKWSTKSKKIATVTQGGVITGRKKGSTKVTVATQNGLKATVNVKVKKAPSKVSVSPRALDLAVGRTARLKALLPKDTASQIAWESSDEGVAIVDYDGTVLACAPGTAMITARAFNGKRASCAVTVSEGTGEDRALRDRLVGDWEVTEVISDGLHADTCARFITLTVNRDSTCYLAVYKGKYTGGGSLHWTTQGGQLLVLDDGGAMALQPDGDVKRLALEVDGTTMIFTRDIDPAPYYYSKHDVAPEDVNGSWVADRVSFLGEGLTFAAGDIGFEARLEVDDQRVFLSFPDGGQTRTLDARVWYGNGQITPEESEDLALTECFWYYPELGAVACRLNSAGSDIKVYFKRG